MPEDYVPWDGWDPDCHIGSLSGEAATQENIQKMHAVAARQTASMNMEFADVNVIERYDVNYSRPSLELFMELVWDRTEHLHMTDKEVKELAIWSGHIFLKYSLGKLAEDLANTQIRPGRSKTWTKYARKLK